MWLDGDHYKWRAMRANGVPERFCTGDASDWEKFEAWARTVPDTLRNPLYHWTHMELHRPFGVDALLSPATAREVFDRCNAKLAGPGVHDPGPAAQFRVAVVCTTDDPIDSLEHHAALAKRKDPDTRVFPTWRPDKAFAVEDPAAFNAWVDRLEQVSGRCDRHAATRCSRRSRRATTAFHEVGCRASDHGLETMFAATLDRRRASRPPSTRVRSGQPLDRRPRARAEVGAAARARAVRPRARLGPAVPPRRAAQQQHAPAPDARARHRLRLASATSSMARPLARFLDRLDETNQLAKTILYNLNPRDNELFATMIGNFQDGTVPGKMQYGSAWWFLDQLDGMTKQINALSNMGLLSRFVGMVTDSRSFLSYSRHEYFRRLLCNLLGEDVQRGYLPDDRDLLGALVQNVCFFNARDYFGFTLGRAADGVTRERAATV